MRTELSQLTCHPETSARARQVEGLKLASNKSFISLYNCKGYQTEPHRLIKSGHQKGNRYEQKTGYVKTTNIVYTKVCYFMILQPRYPSWLENTLLSAMTNFKQNLVSKYAHI